MVNTGQGPSKGCTICIQRKIRCDRGQPICCQCKRSRPTRKCGYRNTSDVLFINQTEKTIAKAQAQVSSPEWNAIIPYLPLLSFESGTVDFFINNFTCGVSTEAGTNLFWVPRNLDELLGSEHARLSTQCVGAMALARLHRSSEYFREAQKLYGQALLSLADSWKRSVDLEKDAILITILFLGFFEILASYNPSSRQAWNSHLGGIGALLDMRSEQFFTTDFGARMLLQSRNQAILNALQTKTRIPDVFRRQKHHLHSLKQPMSPHLVASQRAEMLLMRLADIQAQYHSSGWSPKLMESLNALRQDLSRWCYDFPSSWSFSSLPCKKRSTEWWNVRHDVYSKPIVTHVWNKIRAAKLVVHELYQEIANVKTHPPLIAQPSHSDCDVKTLITNICATVPPFYRPTHAAGQFAANADANRPALGATYWLLWPLEIVGSMRDAPLALRTWIVACLDRIHETTGIVKAQVAADRIRRLTEIQSQTS